MHYLKNLHGTSVPQEGGAGHCAEHELIYMYDVIVLTVNVIDREHGTDAYADLGTRLQFSSFRHITESKRRRCN